MFLKIKEISIFCTSSRFDTWNRMIQFDSVLKKTKVLLLSTMSSFFLTILIFSFFVTSQDDKF